MNSIARGARHEGLWSDQILLHFLNLSCLDAVLLALTRAPRARCVQPPEVAEKLLAALQPRAHLVR